MSRAATTAAPRPRVVLVYPGFTGGEGPDIDPSDLATEKVVPMGCLALGAYLESQGFAVTLLDGRMLRADELVDQAVRAAQDAVCVGLSAMTIQVSGALRVADALRAARGPRIPIVWGGTHATEFPRQTLADPACDFVVVGEGELAFASLLSALAAGRSPDPHTPGLAGAADRAEVPSPAPPVDPAALPPPAYHLLDLERYIHRRTPDGRTVRGMDVLASRGCPYRCTFCLNPSLGQRRWRPRRVEQVLADASGLIRDYRINHLWFMDDYFFGRPERTEQFVDFFLSHGGRVTWEVNLRASDLRPDRLSDAGLARLRASGLCVARIGMESGSDRMLRRYQKDITVEDIERAVRRLVAHDIFPLGFWMMGAPGETLDDITRTLELIHRLHEVHPADPHWVPGVFRPYPGSALYAEAQGLGFAEPQSLRQWAARPLAAGYVAAKDLPWIPDRAWIEDLQQYYSRWLSPSLGGGWKGILRRAVYGPLARLARWRCRTGRWDWRVETVPFRVLRRVAARLPSRVAAPLAGLCGGGDLA